MEATGPTPLIDVHCHILPGLDDGAVDLDDAIGMASQADADGIGLVCATPHIRHDHRVEVAELTTRVAALNHELVLRGRRVRVLTGGEVAETALDDLDDAALRALTLGGGGRWILLEPAPGPLGDSLLDATARLATGDFGTVIAHPERHADAQLGPRLQALVKRGALVQATAAFVVDEHAGPPLLDLARRGLVHLLGSDAHSARAGRAVQLSPAFDALRAAGLSERRLRWIGREAPRAVVRGQAVSPPPP